MKPDAIYTFRQFPTAHTRYIQAGKHGDYSPDGFPAVYVRGELKGMPYVGFRNHVVENTGHRKFTHAIEGRDARMYTGFNFDPGHPRRVYGDFNGDALLIEFSQGWDCITVCSSGAGRVRPRACSARGFRGRFPKRPAGIFWRWSREDGGRA